MSGVMGITVMGLGAMLCMLAFKAMTMFGAMRGTVERLAGLGTASRLADTDRLRAGVIKEAMSAWPPATHQSNGKPPEVPDPEIGIHERMSL